MSTKPPAGYHPAQHSKHGGWTDGHGNYWYPGQAKMGEGTHKHESGRWVHNDENMWGDADLDAEFNADHHKKVAARNKAQDHHKSGLRELEHYRDKGDHAVVIPDASHPGKYRYSEYDDRGFRGHQTFDTEALAYEAAADAGFHKPAKGSLSKLSGTDKWAEGTRHAKIMQLVNGLPRGSVLGNMVMDYYSRHGHTQAALDNLMDHHTEIRAGRTWPKALHKAMSAAVAVWR